MRYDNDILQLRLAYKDKLPEKLKALESQWALLRGTWDKQKLTEFYKFVHKFHGSAGSYGYADISKKLNLLESKLSELNKLETLSKEHEETIQMLIYDIKTIIVNVLQSE